MDVSDERVVIGRIRASEGPVLRELRLRSLRDAPDAFGQPLDEAVAAPDAEWTHVARAASEGDQRAWFIAFLDAHPVGLVQGRRRRPGVLLLFSLWVAPAARRRGVAARLVAALEAWAGDWGASETVLWVIHGNEPALTFYRALGFEAVWSGPDAAAGAQHGATAMRRSITPG